MDIAEILKYCPKGTKLYSTAFGEVEFINIAPLTKLITVQDIYNSYLTFYSDGSYASSGECVLFPSKDQRDWSKFRLPLKKGDIMMKADGTIPFIASGELYKENKLLSALIRAGYKYDQEQHKLVKQEFKPFDKVLVRNCVVDEWLPGFFYKLGRDYNHPYHIMNLHHLTDYAYKQCIPYEGNEYLLGTINPYIEKDNE